MTFDEYVKNGRARYEALIEAVQTILVAAMKPHGLVPHGIKGRAKEPASLAKKLEMRKIDPGSAIDEELKDLAGVRIVFLTNGQVDIFGREGILRENFEILNVNVHHPVPDTETEDRPFDSTNYTVALKAERLALPEYADFAGLRCEIQVQTLLNHAWAEMDHDAFYKQPDIGKIGAKQLNAIKRRMNAVMEKHLVPAGHDFDQIAGDMQRLIDADGSFDATFATLATSKDNRELAGALSTLGELILPQVDQPEPLFLKHLPDLVGAVERTRGAEAVRIDTTFGGYLGQSGEDVARQAGQVISKMRYADPAATIDALLQLHGGATSDVERKIWTDVARELSANNLDIWKTHGPIIARFVLDALAKLDAKAKVEARGLIVAMLGNILSADMQGMSANSGTVTIHHGVVPVSDAVIAIRHEAMMLLETLLETVPDDGARREILVALRKAGHHPLNAANAELGILVRRDAARVLRSEAARAAAWGLELRRQSEANALRVRNRFTPLPEFLEQSDDAIAAQSEVEEAVAALRAVLDADAEYGLYKTLVGRDSVSPAAWEGALRDLRATEVWRTAAYPRIVEGMGDDAAGEWIERARRFVGEGRSGSADLFPLASLFGVVGKEKPAIAVALLDAMDDTLAVLIRHILIGLDNAGEHDLVRRYVERWQDEGRFLPQIGDYLWRREPAEIDMLEALTARAIELGSIDAVLAAMTAAVAHHDRLGDRRLIDGIFMPAVGYVTETGRSDWVHFIWGGGNGTLIDALDEGEAQRLLASFVNVPDLGFEEDRILAIVARRFAGLVFEFFEARIRRRRERNDPDYRYNAVPFDIYELRDALAPHPERLIAATRQWFDIEPGNHDYQGGRLFHNVYPELPPEVAKRLSDLVAGRDQGDINFVLGLLAGYGGSELVYPVCMDIVDALDDGDPLLMSVVRVLAQTGVLVGEFGLVKAEAEQRAKIAQYAEDPRPKVAAFVRDQAHRIQQSMASEQRMAVRQAAARRRSWGEE